ncbi:MAG: hypothetical protein J6S11_01180 [Bacteroidaceae bacterium]|nr:hypothetical protein [Bacteroidaceae bacterium]
MRRNRLFILAAMLPALSAMQAQTSYEAAELLDTDLNGTARFVGMGGAMGALGADISTMGTNPAGIALFRSWDASISFSGNAVTQRTTSNMGRNRSFASYGSMDNVGMVIANKMSNEDIVRFVNFGVNYRNVTSFEGKMGMQSALGGLSQTSQMAWQAYEGYLQGNVFASDFDPNSTDGFYNINYYTDDRLGWLTLMGADARLIDGTSVDGGKYYPSDYNSYSEYVSGGINAYDFNLSVNLIDAVYLGATLTTYNVDRQLESTYAETFSGGDYTFKNFYRTVGTGWDLKFGAILRPIEESSFRIGISATTPTVYNLRDYNSAIINSKVTFVDDEGYEWQEQFTMDTFDENAFGADCETKYTMIAPAKMNVSLGGTIGTSWALGLEYEHTNYAVTKLFYGSGNENQGMNEHTAANFNAKETLRLGVEKMFAGSFYTRLGYNYQRGGYKKDAWKMIPINSVQTNTAYKNINSTNNFTCGVGYRGSAFYADAALLYSNQSADFYPFDDPELEATKLSRNLVRGAVTLGLRF